MLEDSKIREMILKGYDPEVISTEFGIPLESVTKHMSSSVTNDDNTVSRQKTNLSSIRQKYYALYNVEDRNKKIDPFRNISDENKQLIEKTIETIEEIAKDSNTQGRSFKIIREYEKIKEYPLTVLQGERLLNSFSIILEVLKQKKADDSYHKIGKLKYLGRCICTKISSRLATEIESANSLEEINRIKDKIENIFKGDFNDLIVSTPLRESLRFKEDKLKEEKLKTDIPDYICNILNHLCDNNLDIEDAKKQIEDHAKMEVEKENNNFTIHATIRGQKLRIANQITTLLSEKSSEFRLKYPEEAVKSLQDLLDISVLKSVETVANNLIDSKDFYEAKALVEKYSKSDSSNNYNMILRKIDLEEIGDMLLKGIKILGTEEEEESFFNSFIDGIKKANIYPEKIPLGKTKNGMRKIYLRDVWSGYKKLEEDKSR